MPTPADPAEHGISAEPPAQHVAEARFSKRASRTGSTARRRLALLAAACATVAGGLAVHFLLTGPGADFAGDALYAVLVYLVVAIVAPRLPSGGVGGIALALCVAIETFQLTGIPAQLSDRFAPAALLLGSTFAPLDLMAYLLGVVAATFLDGIVRARARARGRRPARWQGPM